MVVEVSGLSPCPPGFSFAHRDLVPAILTSINGTHSIRHRGAMLAQNGGRLPIF